MMSWSTKPQRVRWLARLRKVSMLMFVALTALNVPLARAHNGPPFPIIVDQRVGPCIVSLWTHPDVGVGTFFVMVDATPLAWPCCWLS